MADYLKEFATMQEYEDYLNSDYPKPNVSYVNETDETFFTNYDDEEGDSNKYVALGIEIANFSGTQFANPTTYIEKIVVPEGVTALTASFQSYRSLKSVSLPSTLTNRLPDRLFFGCTALESIVIPNSVTSIGMYAFKDCSALTSVTIGNSVTNIGDWAFQNCTALTSVTIGNSVTNIGNTSFKNCTALTSVTIPNSVTNIGNMAFQNCTGLTTATFGNSVKTIGDEAFRSCTGLTSITIPDSVTRIGHQDFSGCTALTSVTIGNSVTFIGYSAFSGCSQLQSLTIKATTPPTLGTNPLQDTPSDMVIYVPAESVDTYKAADGWSDYASKIQAIP